MKKYGFLKSNPKRIVQGILSNYFASNFMIFDLHEPEKQSSKANRHVSVGTKLNRLEEFVFTGFSKSLSIPSKYSRLI